MKLLSWYQRYQLEILIVEFNLTLIRTYLNEKKFFENKLYIIYNKLFFRIAYIILY